ncbi:unnamed protein product [Camellia sinensis]
MVACLACTPDTLPGRNPFPRRSNNHHHHGQQQQRRFGHRIALSLLQNCRDFKQLKQIHARIIRNGLSQEQSLLAKLIRLCDSYAKMDYATLLLLHHPLPNPNPNPNPPFASSSSSSSSTFAWNLVIRSHTLNGSPHQALLLYNLMICRGLPPPDKFTFPFVIKACLASSSLHKGKEVHVLAFKCGFSHDIFLQNTLMDLYFKCGDFDYGRKVFDKMRVRNIVSWTTMVSGLVACCADLDAARLLFEQMPIKNVVSWTTMINGYARNRRPHDAFEFFWRMQRHNVKPNEFTLVSLLIACAELGSLNLGRWIHDFALKNGFTMGIFLGTALIDMYSKCGSLEDAKQVFDSMQVRSTATWNSMITSLGVHGHGEEALDLFAKMEMANIQPDAITFVGVLCACVRVNNVTEGRKYFKYMSERYGITPNAEHYTCIIELCSHDNMLDEACKLAEVDDMPS